MTIKFNCPHCQQHLEVEELMIGEVAECPSCENNITIPGVEEATATPAPEIESPPIEETPVETDVAPAENPESYAAPPVATEEPPAPQMAPKAAPVQAQSSPPSPASQGTADTKPCPFCGEAILKVAVKCKHCGEHLQKKSGNTGRNICWVISAICFLSLSLWWLALTSVAKDWEAIALTDTNSDTRDKAASDAAMIRLFGKTKFDSKEEMQKATFDKLISIKNNLVVFGSLSTFAIIFGIFFFILGLILTLKKGKKRPFIMFCCYAGLVILTLWALCTFILALFFLSFTSDDLNKLLGKGSNEPAVAKYNDPSRFDGSSDAAFEASLKRFEANLPKRKLEELQIAVGIIAAQIAKNGGNKDDVKKAVHGKSCDEVIAIAKRILNQSQ